MADPFTVIGAAGALAGILGRLAQTIATISNIHSQWQNSDLAVVTLESQLSALNTAIRKIREWMEVTSQATLDSQLVFDLDRCMICCRTLVTRLSDEVSKLATTEHHVLSRLSKLRLLMNTSEFRHIQRMIDQQTRALTLLLVACNTGMVAAQRAILVQPEARQMIEKLCDYTESLRVHRDVDSIFTSSGGRSMSSSQRSLSFDFDSELLTTRSYQRWMRGSLKKRLWEQQHDTRYEVHSQSAHIDYVLQKVETSRRDDQLILVMGSESRINLMRLICLDISVRDCDDERLADRVAVLIEIRRSARQLVVLMQAHGIARPESEEVRKAYDAVILYSGGEGFDRSPYTVNELEPDFILAVDIIRETALYQHFIHSQGEIRLSETSKYFLSRFDKISEPGYLPSPTDLMRSSLGGEYLTMGGCRLRTEPRPCLVDPGSDFLQTAYWSCIFSNSGISSFVFVFDLSTYDKVDDGQNVLDKSIAQLNQVLAATPHIQPRVLLIMDKFREFQAQLATKPMREVFADFPDDGASAGWDWEDATQYIVRRFEQSKGKISPIIIDLDVEYVEVAFLFARSIKTHFLPTKHASFPEQKSLSEQDRMQKRLIRTPAFPTSLMRTPSHPTPSTRRAQLRSSFHNLFSGLK